VRESSAKEAMDREIEKVALPIASSSERYRVPSLDRSRVQR
jgi:hypothetical protein